MPDIARRECSTPLSANGLAISLSFLPKINYSSSSFFFPTTGVVNSSGPSSQQRKRNTRSRFVGWFAVGKVSCSRLVKSGTRPKPQVQSGVGRRCWSTERRARRVTRAGYGSSRVERVGVARQ